MPWQKDAFHDVAQNLNEPFFGHFSAWSHTVRNVSISGFEYIWSEKKFNSVPFPLNQFNDIVKGPLA